MSEEPVLRIEGEVEQPLRLTYAELSTLGSEDQIVDVSRVDASRKGDAVKLSALLQRASVKPAAGYLGLHATADDFHASIPLSPVRDNAMVIYRLDGQPLSAKSGGPFRFYIPNHAECHTDEIDECANVKFVDRIELTIDKGYDNRPEDDEEHARLHGGS